MVSCDGYEHRLEFQSDRTNAAISQTLVLIFGCIGNIILYSIPQTLSLRVYW